MMEKIGNSAKEGLVRQIISEEYQMFSNVQNIGGRASCQDDFDTFYIMRSAQHSIFGMRTLESYFNDIREAQMEGRNLIAEKYSWMMEETDSAWFAEKLKPYLPKASERKMLLAERMTQVFMGCYESVKENIRICWLLGAAHMTIRMGRLSSCIFPVSLRHGQRLPCCWPARILYHTWRGIRIRCV